MAKFRKKPVTIEAVQWFKMGDHPAVEPYTVPGEPLKKLGWVATLEGGHIVTPGDWIITGVKGEFYPCKPDIFAMTYEVADTPASASVTVEEVARVLCIEAGHDPDDGNNRGPNTDAFRDAARAVLALLGGK